MDDLRVPRLRSQQELRAYLIQRIALANDVAPQYITDSTPVGAAYFEICTVLTFSLADGPIVMDEGMTLAHVMQMFAKKLPA